MPLGVVPCTVHSYPCAPWAMALTFLHLPPKLCPQITFTWLNLRKKKDQTPNNNNPKPNKPAGHCLQTLPFSSFWGVWRLCKLCVGLWEQTICGQRQNYTVHLWQCLHLQVCIYLPVKFLLALNRICHSDFKSIFVIQLEKLPCLETIIYCHFLSCSCRMPLPAGSPPLLP